MEDKKQDKKSLEELVKTADSYRAFFANLANELSKVLTDVKAPDEEENTWEMKCPYEYGDKHYCIQSSGDVFSDSWRDTEADNSFFSQGNIFPTKEAAELEAKRRKLLTRFRAFRDECNGGWKPDWSSQDKKWEIDCDYQGLKPLWINKVNGFPTFGHFENEEDCKKAIELYGDEIRALFVDLEEE